MNRWILLQELVLLNRNEPPETHLNFSNQYDISYLLLSDPDARHIKAFGILNESYKPGHRAHGVPHPGIFIIDQEGIVRAKFAEDGYRKRPSIDLVLEATRKMLLD